MGFVGKVAWAILDDFRELLLEIASSSSAAPRLIMSCRFRMSASDIGMSSDMATAAPKPKPPLHTPCRPCCLGCVALQRTTYWYTPFPSAVCFLRP